MRAPDGEGEHIRILAVADVEARRYYDHYVPGSLKEFDLILACGDLRREYLDFLVTMAGCPVLYVRGNHDDALIDAPVEGCICVEDAIYVHQGVRVLGLGGSQRYRDGRNMYNEAQMCRRIRRLRRQIRKHRGFDILLAHAPAEGLGDLDTRPHRGFRCFRTLMERYRPRYFVHGHVHRCYCTDFQQVRRYGDTVIVNASEYCIFDY